jgi:type I restriction enzyme S subunit
VKITKLKWLVSQSNAGEVIDKSHWGSGVENLYTCAKEPMSSDFPDFPINKKTQPNDLLLTRNGTPYIHIPSPGSIYSNVVQRITVPHADRTFLRYALNSRVADFRGYGVSIESFNYEMWGNLDVSVPDLSTQKRIAAFLERETTRIDELIAKKERLLGALDAKLRNAISVAVTNGITARVDRIDSGIDWIGDIPAHWTVMKLGYLGRCANGINIGGDAFGSGYPFISYGDVYKNRVLPTEASGLVQSSVGDRKSYTVEAGDVFFTRTSETIEEVGFSSVCMETIEDAVFAGFLIRFRPRKGQLDPHFSKFAFQHAGLRDYFAKEMNLITRASLSQDLLRNMPVALPPMAEQAIIALHLEALEVSIRAISEKTQLTIEKLKERRAALITAAVTGHIDVDTYGKAGATSATLNLIEEEMQG